ncbi:hypothetical protein MC885_015172 [Smutsia gigantea]|nr:hypothetical protein MC885_015172 [Smutsia gigantea]
MILLINRGNCKVAGFVIATIGWILSTTSVGLVEWQVWYMDTTSLLPSGLAYVGLWKVYIYQHISNFSRTTLCCCFIYCDTYVPLAICVAQILLLVASILGLLRKALTICVCISVAVIWNYHSVVTEEGIAFPPSFLMPFKPDTQETGRAILVASLAAFMLVLSGLIFLSYKFPRDNRVHTEASEI